MDKQSEASNIVILIDDQTLDCIFRIFTQAKGDLRTTLSFDRETGKILNVVPVGLQYRRLYFGRCVSEEEGPSFLRRSIFGRLGD